MESRLGHDFAHVRVHTDAAAARSAAAVGAQAYTVGSDVVFGAGRYAPTSGDGRQLLAHELTHVVQQRRSEPFMQRKPDPKQPAGVTFSYSVHITKVLNPDELLVAFVRQYYDLASDEEAVALRDQHKWNWIGDKPPTVGESDVKKRYILVIVTDSSMTPGTDAEKNERGEFFKGLAPAEQSDINKETDEQFWQKTKYRPGQKLGKSVDDKRMTEYWKVIRDQLIAKREIDALPDAIQAFLFDETAAGSVQPKDFATVLRIASKAAALAPAELAEYKSRVTAKTTDWAEYESAVDRFITERRGREGTAQERREIETKLFRLDEFYSRYRECLLLQTTNSWLAAFAQSNPQAAGTSLGGQFVTNDVRSQLDTDMIRAGFPGGVGDLEKLIADYAKVFDDETHAVAKVMLDQYEHQLWVEEQKYQKPGAVDALHEAVAPAGREYEEAEKIRSEHASSVVLSLDEMADQAYWVGKRNEALARAGGHMTAAAGAHPLLKNSDFDREKLARAPKGDMQSQMLPYIAARRKDIAETRKNLLEHPRMIFGLDDLLKASKLAQKIQPGSVYETIINDHIKDEAWKDAIPTLILAVVAIAAGLLTGGGGAVAVIGAGTVLGIGAYQAIDEFKRYERTSAAHGAQLTSEDPTMAWVIVAVIGAGFDAAALGSALEAVKFRAALAAFNAGPEAGDVTALTTQLKGISEVPESIRTVIIAKAGEEKAMRAAWKSIVKPPPMLRMVLVPLAAEFGQFVYAVYLSAKRGIREFQLFVKTDEFVSLVGDVAKLSDADLVLLKTGFSQAIKDMEAVAAHGKSLKMADAEIDAFMKLRAQAKGMTVEQTLKEMETWKTTEGVAWKGFSKGKLKTHFEGHGGEFAGLTQPQYLNAAKDFATEIGSFKVQQVGDFLVKYDPVTRRTLVARIADREIRTFYIADLRDADPFQAAIDMAKLISGK